MLVQACCPLGMWNGAQHHAVPPVPAWQQTSETTSTACAFRRALLQVAIKRDDIVLLSGTSCFVDTSPQKGVRAPECRPVQQQYLGKSSVRAGLPVLPPSREGSWYDIRRAGGEASGNRGLTVCGVIAAVPAAALPALSKADHVLHNLA